MKTDSENNMMNKFFSLHSIGGGRFLFLILLSVNFQMIHAVCRHSDAPSSDMTAPSTGLFISDDAVISGMENIYIHHPVKEVIKKKAKRKNSSIPNKRKFPKEQKISQSVKNSNKTVLIFRRDTQSEKSLLAVSDNDKQIVRPNQNTIKFLLPGSENEKPVLINLLDIFLKKHYKSYRLSSLRFFRNFQRPPPFMMSYYRLT